jgi:hypothetical protein
VEELDDTLFARHAVGIEEDLVVGSQPQRLPARSSPARGGGWKVAGLRPLAMTTV